MRRTIMTLAVTALLVTACGSPQVTDAGVAPSAAPRPSAVRTSTAPTPHATAHQQATKASDERSQTEEATDQDVPGEPVAWADALNTHAEAGVTGVEAGDVLNVRARPGADQPIVDRLAPLRTGLRLTGEARMIGTSPWLEITTGDTTGWVHSTFVNLVAGTTDVTGELRDAGVMPTADTMRDMADAVLMARGLAEGYQITWGPDRDPNVGVEQQRRVVISDGPTVGHLGEITIDVIDTFDDSIAAERLTIFGEPNADGGFTLRSVELTSFCHVIRGAGELCA